MKRFLRKNFSGDKWLVVIPLVLSTFGLLMIFDASNISAIRDFNDQFHYLFNQLTWFVVGWLSFLFFSKFDYRKLKKYSIYFFLVNIFLLILVLIPGLGKEVLGGKRWLLIGPMTVQPSELLKLSMVFFLSTLLEKKKELWLFLIIIAAIFGLLILEPDLGTSVIVIVTAISMYFVSGAPVKNFLILFLSGAFSGLLMIFGSDYRKKRLMTFFNSSHDIQGDSYHVRQILLALGSGGLFGRGFGQSRQKYLFLPEVTTDSIFAVIAEEFGIFGSGLLIFTFVFLIYRGLKTAVETDNLFDCLLACGIIIFIGVQTIINLSAMVSLVPLTGIPLPFISYGGSSLVVVLSGMGILYNISKNNQKIK